MFHINACYNYYTELKILTLRILFLLSKKYSIKRNYLFIVHYLDNSKKSYSDFIQFTLRGQMSLLCQ